MKHWENWAAGGALTFCLLVAWFSGNLFHLRGTDLLLLRAGLALFGLCAVGALWWWFRAKRPPKAARNEASQGDVPQSGSDEIEVLIREADSRLRSSQTVRGASVRGLPAFLVLGFSGSAKTSIMIQSGIEPELLAGQVSREGNSVAPTRSINLWLARETIFAEIGGQLLSKPADWSRLVKRLAPTRLGSIVGRTKQAPRAAVVCVDCEDFVKPGGPEQISAASQNLRARLGEISRLLGISLPVYVVFGKMDRLKFFAEYTRNLGDDEANRVFGMTLPAQSSHAAGVYGELETKRLTTAFDHLFYALNDARGELLRREHQAERLPAIYEFPREFRKLRAPVVQFLVDLCRPSQLAVGPFLRGFYVTGCRTVVVNSPAVAGAGTRQLAAASFQGTIGGATQVLDVNQMRAQAAFETSAPPDATRVFDANQVSFETNLGRTSAALSPPELRPQPKEVQQWVFLRHLFSEALLADQAALGASGSSTKVHFWQKLILGCAAGLFLICCVAFTLSYINNHELSRQVLDAAQDVSARTPPGGPTLESLQRLDRLRERVEELSGFERGGAPLRLRWGLYAGHDLYPQACGVYSRAFRQSFLKPVQTAWVTKLRALPDMRGPNDEFPPAYEALKAYLITTTEHLRSTRDFLPPVLLGTWAAGRVLNPEPSQLIQKQFDFYSDELRHSDQIGASACFASDQDAPVVKHAQYYLSQFPAKERVYRAMLTAAASAPGNHSIRFNRDFPESAGVVLNNLEIPAAFTKTGWEFMQEALKHPEQYFRSEDWVLGSPNSASIDSISLAQQIGVDYKNEFMNQWRQFLKNTSIPPYSNFADAARRLGLLAGNRSPLMELFWVVSRNTSPKASSDPELAKLFQPAQSVVPAPEQNQYVGPQNNDYLANLLMLKNLAEQYANTRGVPDDNLITQISASALAAQNATDKMALSFAPDPSGVVDRTVSVLMLAPITSIKPLMPKPGTALNGQGGILCSQPLFAKYPFNPRTDSQATVQEINAFFQPGSGNLWTFVDANLKPLGVMRQGTRWVQQPGAKISISPAFLNFLDRASALSDALYAPGSAGPHLQYSLQVNPGEEIKSLTLNIDGQTLQYSGTKSSARFEWPAANPPGIQIKANGQDMSSDYKGLWAAFQFFADGTPHREQAGYVLEYPVGTQFGKHTAAPSARVRLHLDAGAARPLFELVFFSSSGLRCVRKVTE